MIHIPFYHYRVSPRPMDVGHVSVVPPPPPSLRRCTEGFETLQILKGGSESKPSDFKRRLNRRSIAPFDLAAECREGNLGQTRDASTARRRLGYGGVHGPAGLTHIPPPRFRGGSGNNIGPAGGTACAGSLSVLTALTSVNLS